MAGMTANTPARSDAGRGNCVGGGGLIDTTVSSNRLTGWGEGRGAGDGHGGSGSGNASGSGDSECGGAALTPVEAYGYSDDDRPDDDVIAS